MALTQQQIQQLAIAAQRRNPTDMANIAYAAKQGYVDPGATYTPPTGTTRIPNPQSM